MHLLIVTNLFPPHVLGGYEILCSCVVDELRRRGHRCSVLTSDHGVAPGGGGGGADGVRRVLGLYAPFTRPAGLERSNRWVTGRRNYTLTRRAIDELRPDAAFVWSQLRLTVGSAYAARDAGLPTAYTFNDDHVTGYRAAPFGGGPRGLARFIADRVVYPDTTVAGLDLSRSTCISRALREQICLGGVDVAGSEVIYQGIPLQLFPLKERPGSRGGRLRVMYAGQLHDYKGVHVAVGAVLRLLAAGEDVEMDVAGAGTPSYEEGLRRLVAEAGREAEERVRFLGRIPRDELARRYRAADVFVFPSIWAEPFGLTHLEAMASGTPVVSTTGGGPGEFLVDGANALTVPAGDEEATARAIGRLALSAELRERLALGGRETVERGFTMTTYVDRLEDFVLRAARSAGRRAA